jgi:hypothetical protein
MKRYELLLVLALFVARGHAQERDTIPAGRPDFIISLNLVGDASLISMGFEKLFFIKPAFTLAGRLGFGFNQEFLLFSSDPPRNYFIMPMAVSCNFGKKRSYLECGLGGSVIAGGRTTYFMGYPILGYRLHPFRNPGFSFRAWLFYPFGQLSVLESTDLLMAPFGVSIGIAL